MMGSRRWQQIFIICLLWGFVVSQIPGFGACPNYSPLLEFDVNKFLGRWYEMERMFTVTELAGKCISVNYEKRPDGNIWVENSITNRFTGVERKISGTMGLIGTTGIAKYNIRYTSLPINYDAVMNVLDTDYKNFAVIYSCSRIGPFGHTQSVWLMTRERNPPGLVLQRAYGILDKYKISRTFFLKTHQNDCEIVAPPEEATDYLTTSEPTQTATETDNAITESIVSEVVVAETTTVGPDTLNTDDIEDNN